MDVRLKNVRLNCFICSSTVSYKTKAIFKWNALNGEYVCVMLLAITQSGRSFLSLELIWLSENSFTWNLHDTFFTFITQVFAQFVFQIVQMSVLKFCENQSLPDRPTALPEANWGKTRRELKKYHTINQINYLCASTQLDNAMIQRLELKCVTGYRVKTLKQCN